MSSEIGKARGGTGLALRGALAKEKALGLGSGDPSSHGPSAPSQLRDLWVLFPHC